MRLASRRVCIPVSASLLIPVRPNSGQHIGISPAVLLGGTMDKCLPFRSLFDLFNSVHHRLELRRQAGWREAGGVEQQREVTSWSGCSIAPSYRQMKTCTALRAEVFHFRLVPSCPRHPLGKSRSQIRRPSQSLMVTGTTTMMMQ